MHHLRIDGFLIDYAIQFQKNKEYIMGQRKHVTKTGRDTVVLLTISSSS